MAQQLIEQLFRAAVARDLDRTELASLASRYAHGASRDLLSDFAEFVAQRFVAGELDFLTANGAMNQVMPVAGFEDAPQRFWEAYVAFEEFETVADPDEQARLRIRKLLTGWNAA